ncbi:MAG: branched-chain amino acid ABC transporter permease [Dehalococcoidia bacterium]|nr:branched-chain amino acid ABC transporter permease [Dehalococcoidia bacterium]
MWAQGIVNGLMSAGIYILVALGLTLVLSILGIVQLAHGEVYMLGAYGVYYLCAVAGLEFFMALVISTVLVGGLGILLERLFFRPLRGDPERAVVISIGLILFLQTAVFVGAGGVPKATPNPLSGVINIFGIVIPWDRLVVVVVAFGLVAALFLLISKSRIGQAMVAVSQDRQAAAIQGINVDRISSIVMFSGSALAAVAGGLVGAMFSLTPGMGSFALMKGIAVIILGGLGSIPGAVLGGLIIGLTDGIVPLWLTTHIANMIGFVMIILILIFKPRGLLGHE